MAISNPCVQERDKCALTMGRGRRRTRQPVRLLGLCIVRRLASDVGGRGAFVGSVYKGRPLVSTFASIINGRARCFSRFPYSEGVVDAIGLASSCGRGG